MRASPRPWPSIRPSLFSMAALASRRMPSIYPRGVSGSSGRMMAETAHHDHDHAVTGRVIDPVCGMPVDPHKTQHRHAHHGHTYYFCSAGCRTKFAADPAKYLDKNARDAEPLPDGTIYTCPMHPDIRQAGPGSCPICGMALERIALEDRRSAGGVIAEID